MKRDQSKVPAYIAGFALFQFFIWGSYVMIFVMGTPWTTGSENPHAFAILEMFVVQCIGLTGGAVGFWLGKTYSDMNKDEMLHNSTPSPVPTEQVVRSVTTSTSTPQPETEEKP